MASSDARPVPQKNVAYRVYFPVFDNDGDLVTGAAGLDSEVSKDGAAFSDCTNEATEIGSSGTYYLDLTSGEMNADAVVVVVKTSSTDAKTTPIFLYPEEAGDIRVNVTQMANDTITAAVIATGAVDADALAADAGTEIGTAVWASGTRTITALDEDAVTLDLDATIRAAVGLASGNLDTQIAAVQSDTNDIQSRLPAALVSGRMDASVGAMAADTVTASALAADAVAEINATVDAALADYDGPTHAELVSEINAVQTDIAGVQTAVNDIPTNAELATALDAIPTAAENADAVWDEDATGHQTQGTFGQAIGDPVSDSDTIWGLVNTNLNATVSSRASQASVDDLPTNAELATALDPLPTAAENASAVWGAAARTLTALDEDSTTLDLDATIRAAVGMASANLDTQIGDLPTNAELATALAGADDAVLSAVAGVQSDTNDIQARLPAALIGGRIDATVGAMQADVLTASAIAPDAIGASELAASAVTEIQSGLATGASITALDAKVDIIDTNVDAVLADTNELQSDWTNGGRLDTILDARASQASVDDLPTNAELATALGAADDAVLAAIGGLNNVSQAQVQTAATAALSAYDPPTRAEATADKDEIIVQINANETKIDTVDTVVDAIKVKTDSLTFTSAGKVDANIRMVNSLAVDGTGTEADPWGPA